MDYEVNDFVKINLTNEIGQIKEITYHSGKSGETRYKIATPSNENGRIYVESVLSEITEDEDWDTVDEIAKSSHVFSEMGTIKWGFCSIKLAVFSDEGMIPHFHFYKHIAPEKSIPKNKVKGGGCICFKTPNYFTHGSHTEKLGNYEIEELVSFLKKPNKGNPKITNWESLLQLWNEENPEEGYELPEDLEIPEYTGDMETIQEVKKERKNKRKKRKR